MRELCGFAGLCVYYAAENIYAPHLCGDNKIYNILIILNILNILFCKYSILCRIYAIICGNYAILRVLRIMRKPA